MAKHPYRSLSREAFWRSSVGDMPAEAVDPVGKAKFTISRSDRIATAGSCFAQHIARHLSQSGFNYLVTETAHPLVPHHVADAFGYGLFTARYANIYTSRQMRQLIERAYGLFKPIEDVWIDGDGIILDPFRPQIQEGGFNTMEEFHADREQHFSAIRTAVETLDCLVFTLGLTESWKSIEDGAVFPLCPGVSGGDFDENKHAFHNLTVSEVINDLENIHSLLKWKNKTARCILTVSPVPLVATASGDHVLSATTMSKSVLRAAAGEFARNKDDVAYFPSYEIITGIHAKSNYFGSDLRSVTEAGVAHVMRLFLLHYGAVGDRDDECQSGTKVGPNTLAAEDLVKVICEEEALQQSFS